jgi:hypothetical protein
MSDAIDKSLLSRLQALRGGSATPEKPAPTYATRHKPPTKNINTNKLPSIKFDVIERASSPTRGDILAARLKNLRSQTEDSPSPPSAKSTRPEPPSQDVDALFETDDKALEEMLAGIETPEPEPEPREEDVKALLEKLSASIPKDSGATLEGDDDDSDGENMSREAEGVIDRFKDEIELGDDMALPSVPENADLQDPTLSKATATAKGIDDITARMAALRASAENDLPSVPTDRPSKPVSRLTSTTKYTDDDADSWCTVCLEDATLRCLGCDGDVYCTRCWREMHVGPAAAWDDVNHKAVQFTRDRKKVALGA